MKSSVSARYQKVIVQQEPNLKLTSSGNWE